MSRLSKSSRTASRKAPVSAPAARVEQLRAEPAGLSLPLQLGTILIALLLLVPPFFHAPNAREAFRQPKLYASGWLALASLFALSWGIARIPRIALGAWFRQPAVRAVLPFLALSTLSLAWTAHPLQTREGLLDLWIGGACLIGWSVGLAKIWLERLLCFLLLPASLLAVIGILQYHNLWQPLSFFGLQAGQRLALTSLAGNPGDLGAYLVLPCLIAQRELLRRLRSVKVEDRDGEAVSEKQDLRRPLAVAGLGVALVLCLYGLALTQTLAALAAVGLGSALLWFLVLPRRKAVGLLAAGAVFGIALIAGISPLRTRVVGKWIQLRQGAFNEVVSGRFDGWQAALWMGREHPFLGVGHGAYRSEFVPAKLALLDRGYRFSAEQTQVVFANAHSEPLEVVADLGLVGICALGYGLWILFGRIAGALPTEAGRQDRALAAGGVAALAVLSLVYFPFRVALVAYPALLFLAWTLRSAPSEVEIQAGRRAAPAGIGGRSLAGVLGLVLLVALGAQSVRWAHRMLASRVLLQVELLSNAAMAYGSAPAKLMHDNLEKLAKVESFDPVAVDLPIARGTQYLFLAQPADALLSYEEALDLEPRPEIYLHLGRALWLLGRRDEARADFGKALRLDATLANQLPMGASGGPGP